LSWPLSGRVSNTASYRVSRYYDPVTAAFITVDPVVTSTQEPYDYAGGDPINTYDLDGQSQCDLSDSERYWGNIATSPRAVTRRTFDDAGKGYSLARRADLMAVAAAVGAAAYTGGLVVGAGCELFTAPETFGGSTFGCALAGFGTQAAASYAGSRWVMPYLNRLLGFGK